MELISQSKRSKEKMRILVFIAFRITKYMAQLALVFFITLDELTTYIRSQFK